MGKLPPSMRSAKLPLAFLKRSPSSSSSSSSSPSSSSPPPPPKPYYPIAKSPLKSKPKKKPQAQALTQTPRVPLFHSPLLSDAISLSTSLLSSSSPSISPNSLLQSFCDAGASPADAVSLFLYLSPSFFHPDRSTFHLLLAHSCLASSSSSLSSAFQVLDLMSSAGFPPEACSIDLAIRALISASRLDDACEFIRRVIRLDPKPVMPDIYSYNFLIRRLARARPVSSVYAFIDELRRDAGFKPNLVTFTVLIDAVCHGRNLREAMRLLGVLADSGFKPDCYVYNTIMKGYCMMDECGGVMEVYNRMKDEGVEPDLVTYNTLVYGLSKAGMVSQARKFLNVMAEMGHFPDAVTYTALMSGMCRKGDALGAVALLGEMEEKGCSPNECTYNTLLMGLCKGKYLEKGLELYQVMTAKGMKLDSPAYATFVRALCRASRVAEAYEVFDYVLSSKSLTDVTAYTALESSLKWLRRAKV